MRSIGEECGVFGVYDENGYVANTTYVGLMALQHRGQESCGIAVNKDKEIYHYKDLGLVNDVFNEKILDTLVGTMGVGHVRYSAAGQVLRENAQPLVLRYVKGALAIAHNGSILNAQELKTEYERSGAIYQTTSDTEIVAYTIARERLYSKSIEEAINRSMKILKGAYSLVVMSPRKLIAARDPWGFRPLCMGRGDGNMIVFASESCALDAVGAVYERDIDPGEIVVVEDGQVRTIRDNCTGTGHLCIFEHIYFARPDSVLDHQFVFEARKAAGRFLAKEHPVEADLVIGVPDSGIGAAIGYAMESGIEYGDGFIKNRYIGRTFIHPTQHARELAVKLKLNPLRNYIKGKRIVMVDDSIVRGTTSGRTVNLLRDAGAKEIHVRISSPPFLYPCYFGTDVPDRDQLVACNKSLEETRILMGADSLGYLSIENLSKTAADSQCGFCEGCFTGRYPVWIEKEKS